MHDTQVYIGLEAAQSLGIKKATYPGSQYGFCGKMCKNHQQTQAAVGLWTKTWVWAISQAWISPWP